MSEMEERIDFQTVVVTVADIYIFTIQNTATFRPIVEVCRIVFDSLRESQRELAGLFELC